MMTEKFNREFKDYTINYHLNKRNWKTGLDFTFKKGHVPKSKGKKKILHKKSVEVQFKKGHTPKNKKKIGSERINTRGYVEIKIGNPSIWELKHRYIYEKYIGEIPDGYVVSFLDRNKLNCELNNLILLSKNQVRMMNREKFYSTNPEITKTGINITNLSIKIYALEKKKKKTV